MGFALQLGVLLVALGFGIRAVLSVDDDEARSMGTALIACMVATLFFIATAGYEMMTWILCGLLVSYSTAFAPRSSARTFARAAERPLRSPAGVSEIR